MWKSKVKVPKGITIEEAQSYCPTKLVDEVYNQCIKELNPIYSSKVFLGHGPLQSLLGVAIKNGLIKIGDMN